MRRDSHEGAGSETCCTSNPEWEYCLERISPMGAFPLHWHWHSSLVMSLVDHSCQQATSIAFDLSVGLFVVRPNARSSTRIIGSAQQAHGYRYIRLPETPLDGQSFFFLPSLASRSLTFPFILLQRSRPLFLHRLHRFLQYAWSYEFIFLAVVGAGMVSAQS